MLENLTGNDKRASVLVSDLDEVLTLISPLWYKKILNNFHKFKDYFKDLGELSDKEILNRKTYYINNWLLKDNINTLPKEIYEEFFNLYTSGTFYTECTPTNFCKGLLTLERQSWVDSIYIVSHTEPETIKDKLRFCKKYLNGKKFKIVLLNPKDKKSEFINSHNINFNTIVDDSLAVVEDYLRNIPLEKSMFREILIPKYGHNNIEENSELYKLAQDKFINLKYYQNIL